MPIESHTTDDMKTAMLIRNKPEAIFLLFLTFHAACWTLLPALVNPNLPVDVIEGLAWGHEWQFGYYKHPPIKPWFLEIAAILSGRGDWAMYLLSQICVVTAFWAIWRLAKDFFSPKLALISVLLLEGIYYHNFTSPEFNVNVAQLPFWAMTILLTWHGLTRRSTVSWALAGACIGFGFLSKYVFLFLAASIVIMLFTVKTFRLALRTPGPWLGALIALIVASPHLYWSVQNKFPTIAYAMEMADPGSRSILNHIFYPFRFLVTQALILVPPLIMLWTLRKERHDPAEKVHSSDEACFFLLFVSLGPPLLMAAVSAVFGWKIRSMWATPLFLISGIALVYLLRNRLSTIRLRSFAMVFGVFFFLSLMVYWGLSEIGPSFTHRAKRIHFPGQALAMSVTEKWHEHYEQPPEIIVGSYWIAGNIAYYAPHRASVFIGADPKKAPWISPSDIQKKGAVIIGRSREDAYKMVPFNPGVVIDKGSIKLAPACRGDLAPLEFWMLILPPGN